MAKSKMVDLWLKKAGRDLRFSKAALTLEEQFFTVHRSLALADAVYTELISRIG
ncbi:MAG: hypothetical protein AAGB31_02670 [Bdellovibrio sp.]